MRNYYEQPYRYQVDTSFPIRHKNLVWDEPSQEAAVLGAVIDEVRPDFFYSLHNAWTGGVAYYLSRDIGTRYHEALYAFLREETFPVQKRPIWRELLARFDDGIVETWSVKKQYDYLERTTASPEALLRFGGGSWDHLEAIRPSALTLVAESGYLRHPADESERPIGGNLRQFKLRVDADSKFLASVLLETWDRLKDQLDSRHPLYRVVEGGWAMPARERLVEGGRPLALQPTRSTLVNVDFDREMTESDQFQACFVDGGFFYLPRAYQLVRLLKASPASEAVRTAISRLDTMFDQALAELARYVDPRQFEVIDHDTLARVQLGSGLTVLNSVLEAA
jgi:hypothetical protein